MSINRYTKDYRLLETVDERGRIRTELEYIGPACHFRQGEKAARAAGRRLALCCAVGWLCLLAALAWPSLASRTLYAVLPCAFNAVTLWMLSTAAWTALRSKEPLNRRDAERFTLRLPAAASFLMLLSAAALLGALLRLILSGGEALPGDWGFLAGNALCLVLALVCRRQRAALDCTGM